MKRDFPVGRTVGLFGLRGELKCDPTSAGRATFSRGQRLDFDRPGQRREVAITAVREHGGRLLLTIDDVHDATSAQQFVGGTFYASREQIELEAAEHLDRDLIGCGIVGANGAPLGVVSGVEHYPSSDMLVVNGKLLPMVSAFVASVDIASKTIHVNELPAGLLD